MQEIENTARYESICRCGSYLPFKQENNTVLAAMQFPGDCFNCYAQRMGCLCYASMKYCQREEFIDIASKKKRKFLREFKYEKQSGSKA